MSVSIKESDSEIEIQVPKLNDLEVKFYNPSFFESLGYSNTLVSIVDTSLPPSQSGMTGGNNETQDNEKLTFPYSQFVYMLRGPPPKTPESGSGIYGFFSNTLEKIFNLFSKKSEPETDAKDTEVPTTTETEIPSTTVLPTNVGEETMKIQQSVVVSPTVISEPKYDTDSVTEEIQPQIESTEQISISESAKSILPPNDVETEVSKVSVAEPIVPVAIETEKPKIDTPTKFWKISIPKVSVTEIPKLDTLEENEKHLKDILWFSKMESKSGIYVNGSFYTILGKHIKLGTVELASENKNSVRDFCSTIPRVEGTLVDKYCTLYSTH